LKQQTGIKKTTTNRTAGHTGSNNSKWFLSQTWIFNEQHKG